MRLACLLTRSGSGKGGGPTAHGVCGVSAWCWKSVHIVHVVADQEHSDCAVPRYWYETKRVWRFVMPTTHSRTTGYNYSTFPLIRLAPKYVHLPVITVGRDITMQ